MSLFSNCGSIDTNTGGIKCDPRKAIPKNMLLGGKAFNSSETANSDAFHVAVSAAVKLAKGSAAKLFPFPEIQGVTNNQEANAEGALGLGLKFILREGKPAYAFDIVTGTALERKLRKFNRQTVPVFIVDDANQVWGKKDSAGNFVGFDALIFVTGKPFSDGSSVESERAQVIVSFVSAADLFDNAYIMPIDFNINSIEGLLDVEFREPSAHVSNAYKLVAEIDKGYVNEKLNVYDTYADEFEDEALWAQGVGVGYATPLVLTTAVKDATNKGWTLTYDNTQFTALAAGAKIKQNFAAPSVLDAADVTGIEGNAIILTK
jgi:hypothetical protein